MLVTILDGIETGGEPGERFALMLSRLPVRDPQLA